MPERHPRIEYLHGDRSTLSRTNSDETLVTQNQSNTVGQNQNPRQYEDRANSYDLYSRSGEISDLSSLFTSGSEETVTNNLKILGYPITSYTTVRELPIVSTFLQPGVLIFSSLKSLDIYSQKNLSPEETKLYHSQGLGIPLLQTSTSMLSIFKINSPFLIIYKYNKANEKSVFCKVYFRILTNNVTCYILIFQLDNGELKTVVLMNNGVKPSVDVVYENTKIRITGVTGTTSTFANGFMQLYILQNSSPSLCDDMTIQNTLESINSSIKNVKVNVSDSNELYSSLKCHQRKATLTRLMNEGKALINTPLATFVDNGDEKFKGLNLFKNGTIKIFETTNDNENNNNMLIMTSILLVLREQEFRKFRGNNKPTFVSHHNSNSMNNN
ncbi:uncharacterized protein AC631_02524 [Debaryomyces fabryi]|uniref:Uncharacterized protein n=1 Tax=Debaryomyces fabryi TaxID=58627 RepID=A0A0V1PZM3_9ASCO|nr:uncharacterized protein AC631_02524 [Debaryomyces fabryi]KSA01716.1 hypothetical protein AC631_02524 [Debaryomyces fabryi]CUM45247.1 unnamed protein product [Debaryomyces fabryi]